MKAILILAVIALAVQAQTPVHKFFHNFVNFLHIDAATQNQVLVDGFECIDYTLSTVHHLVEVAKAHPGHEELLIQNIEQAIASLHSLEHEVMTKCVAVYAEINTYIHQHHNLSYVNTQAKMRLFAAKLIQIAGETVFGILSQEHNDELVAYNIANLINVASGLVEVTLPYTRELDIEKIVEFDAEKFTRGFLQGFLTTLGFNDYAQINNTAQCALDVSKVLSDFFKNPALHHADHLTMIKIVLEGVKNATHAYGRCKQLDMVDTSKLNHKFISAWTHDTANTFMTYTHNVVMNLPTITQMEINMGVLAAQGEYSLAGQHYGIILRQKYEHILF